MFFANALKDYADQLNDLAFLFTENVTVLTFLKFAFLYVVDSLKFVIFYICSLRFFWDFIELPCSLHANYRLILDQTNLFETSIPPTFFQFFEGNRFQSSLWLTGIFNSFFLALPLSVPHLLTVRAFLINGFHAGLFAAGGTLLGQMLFFMGVFFGFEAILLPALSWEPIPILLGCILTVNVLYKMIHTPTLEVLNFQWGKNTHLFVKIFGLNLLLAWTEQAGFFHYFGNLTINNLPTVLQGTEAGNTGFWSFFLSNSLYLSGLFFGSILWTAFFGFLLTVCRNTLSRLFQWSIMRFNEKLHQGILIATCTLCLTSIPYYGLDYLLSAPLGFLSQDRALEFLKTKTYHVSESLEGDVLIERYLNTVPFDQPNRLESVSIPLISSTNTFEDASLDCENLWKNRDSFSQSQGGFQLSNKSKNQNTLSQEVLLENERFCKKFYKSFEETNFNPSPEKTAVENSYKDANQFNQSTNAFSHLEANVDTIAAWLFDPNAFQYYLNPEANYSFESRQNFRERFYKNPVYKVLVHLDMIQFLNGQPESSKLTRTDEASLVTKQTLLRNYLNSIAEYKTLVIKKQTSTPYAEKVYNQQFKGSLDLVRNYFSVSLNSKTESPWFEAGKVLKFDQPLYKTSLNSVHPFLHEELTSLDTSNEVSFSNQKPQKGIETGTPSGLKTQTTQPVATNTKALLEDAKEQYVEKKGSQSDENDLFDEEGTLPFFLNAEELDSTPFYIGWDTSLRKFLVKQSCIPGMPFGNEAFSAPSQTPQPSRVPTYLSFQSWPRDVKALQKLTNQGVSFSYIPLSEKKSFQLTELLNLEGEGFRKATLEDQGLLGDKNLPSYDWRSFKAQTQKLEGLPKDFETYIDLGNTLPPQLGGLSWPGVNLNRTFEILKLKN